MGIAPPKNLSGAVPRNLSSIGLTVGVLAIFLVVASVLLISYPISSSFHGYFVGVDRYRKPTLAPPNRNQAKSDMIIRKAATDSKDPKGPEPVSATSYDAIKEVVSTNRSISSKSTAVVELGSPLFSGIENNSAGVKSESFDGEQSSSNIKISTLPSTLAPSDDPQKVDSKSCDLYHGKWIYDPAGPLYTNNTCPVITQMQNCQGNGRPDNGYENWRWKPHQCNLPRFDPKKFLELMRGKTLAFVGDSVARNQMESMLCILCQVEAPKNRGNRRMQRWYFRSTSTFIVRMWSSWLVRKTSQESIDFAPEGVDKVHLDVPDDDLMEFLPQFDVVVLSSGHWFAKQSAYVIGGKVVGGQLWWPKESGEMRVNNVEAFGVSVETVLSAVASHPNFTGIAVVRSYSPDHYEGGAWNTGGSCTGKTQPVSELARNGFTEVMHEKQVIGFDRAVGRSGRGGEKLRLMDITEAFGYRADGHPGPYRSPDPNKVTKRGPNGEPPPQDCLHWCMPGPIDTWNEIVLEIIRREFGGA